MSYPDIDTLSRHFTALLIGIGLLAGSGTSAMAEEQSIGVFRLSCILDDLKKNQAKGEHGYNKAQTIRLSKTMKTKTIKKRQKGELE